MTRITYIEHTGTEHSVDVPDGLSLMEGAVRFTVPGIDGDCGGACACATCHVYIAPDWAGLVPPMGELERDMLDFAFDVTPESRLACQIKVKPELAGMIVRTPKRQY
ncbi:MAG TPA: 2Fe-2S iron-sulfur cluster-binding protein [Micropepsaceae bacterium]|nr:2Fe-2S iron-sulfur cluster-binding protein [Micropepsaceae bacterium]HRK71671.1 2Fe-2S iron-sulfur cluster-binding protein [Micropepsaceae bacterium]